MNSGTAIHPELEILDRAPTRKGGREEYLWTRKECPEGSDMSALHTYRVVAWHTLLLVWH